MELFQNISFDTEMTLNSVVFIEDDSNQAAEPYLAEMEFEGEVQGHGNYRLKYHSPTPTPGSRTAGDFTGTESLLREDGSQVDGTSRGIWRRDGSAMKLFVLTNQSDGSQHLRLIDVMLHDNPERKTRVVSYSL